jgi:hypothetical protein
MAAVRGRICKRPGCRRWVRRAPKAKFCSDECRALFHAERRTPQLRSSSQGLISCRICGVERHILARHLRASHGLSSAEYRRLHPGAPIVSEHYRGISADRKIDEQGEPYWTRERILRALQRDAKARGKAPSSTEWRRALGVQQLAFSRRGQRRPSLSTVLLVFGSWNAALTAAGLPTRTRYGTGKRKFCKRGHPLRGSNLFVKSDGARTCRACYRKYQREWKRRKRQVPPDRWRVRSEPRARPHTRFEAPAGGAPLGGR